MLDISHTQPNFRFKGCGKCGGDLVFTTSTLEKFWHCIQCGRDDRLNWVADYIPEKLKLARVVLEKGPLEDWREGLFEGERVRGKDIGKKPFNNKFRWTMCEICLEFRWVNCSHLAKVCAICNRKHRKRASFNPSDPNRREEKVGV